MRSLPRPLDSVRWQAESRRGHVESFFLKANDPEQPAPALWLKYTLLIPPGGAEPRLAEVWAIRFDGTTRQHAAAKASFQASDCELSRQGLGVSIGSSELRPGKTRGAVGEGAERIEWDLRFATEGQVPSFTLPSNWMYERGFPKNKTYTSCPDTRFEGQITVGGEPWAIRDWPGMLGHNWGLFHNPQYHWAQCNLFDRPGVVFEGVSARIPIGPFLTPWLTLALVRHEGREIPFNRFSRSLNRSVEADLFHWSFSSRQGEWRLQWEVEANPEDFVGLSYRNPDGVENFCLNSKIATCRLGLWRGRGRSEQQVLQAVGERSCAYEILTRDPGHGIPVLA